MKKVRKLKEIEKFVSNLAVAIWIVAGEQRVEDDDGFVQVPDEDAFRRLHILHRRRVI